MSHQIYIPADSAQAADVISQLVKQGKILRNPKAISWFISHWYLRGARKFDQINYEEGNLTIGYYDDSGTLQFKWDDITAKFQSQLGRLIGINLAPYVTRKGISLDGMRKASIAQIALDSVLPQRKTEKLKRELLPLLLTFGMIGLNVWVEDENSIGIEVVSPWELLPIPPDISDASGLRGIIRRRFVPVDWIKGLTILDKEAQKKLDTIEDVQIPVGQIPSEAKEKFQGSITATAAGSSFYTTANTSLDKLSKTDERQQDVTEFVETWTWTPDGYLAEYIIAAGMNKLEILFRQDFSAARVHPPITTVVDIPAGGFWGKSFVEMLVPMNVEMEYTIARVLQNVQDFDLYGIQYEATTTGVPAVINRGKDGLKRVRWEPDYTAQFDVKPFNITPANSGLLPAEVIKLGTFLMDRLANQPTALMSGEAPGRVDSSAALGTLYETSGIPLSPTAKAIASGVISCYQSILGIIKRLWKDSKIVDVSCLDDSLAGISFDAATGEMKLAENAIPYPDEVEINVRSEVPISKEQEKMELRDELKLGNITPTEYRIEVRKRGLSLPVGNEMEWQNYRRAMLENLVLFKDGQTPGKVIVSERDNHQLHLQVLGAFMARPEFFLASAPVRDAFTEHFEEHQSGLGQLPPQMPYPEDAAAQAMEQMKAMGGQGGPPMM